MLIFNENLVKLNSVVADCFFAIGIDVERIFAFLNNPTTILDFVVLLLVSEFNDTLEFSLCLLLVFDDYRSVDSLFVIVSFINYDNIDFLFLFHILNRVY